MSEDNVFDMPEGTAGEIVEKISSLAWDIRSDWSDPRGQCREIVRLCEKLNQLLHITVTHSAGDRKEG